MDSAAYERDSSALRARVEHLEGMDLRNAGHIIGTPIKTDDLAVVEGIGPKIKELFTDAGVTTWSQLSEMPTERMREILDTGGPNFRISDPGSWAEQAKLLADGNWAEFKKLTDLLIGGR